jgi:hypothetical protein
MNKKWYEVKFLCLLGCKISQDSECVQEFDTRINLPSGLSDSKEWFENLIKSVTAIMRTRKYSLRTEIFFDQIIFDNFL